MAVDKEFLKESKLDGVYKRMRQINEYVITGYNNEADDMQQDQNNTPTDQNMPPDDQNMDNGQNMPPAQDNMQTSGGNNGMPQGQNMGMNNQPMGQDMNDGGGMPPAEPDPTIGAESPDMGDGGEQISDMDMEGDADGVGPDDEVLDVDDLTNSQEAAEYKIDGVDDKLTKLLAIAGKFAKAIEDNENKINDLKSEVEKRNPTDIERINIRSQNSQPFSVNPGAYWDGVRAKNPNYQIISDNNVSPDKEDKVYTITDDDLKNFNTADIEKSFSDYPKDLMGYFE